MTLALLGVGDQALTLEEVRGSLVRLLDYVERRKLPTMGELDLRTEAGVTRALDELVRSDVVACYAEGPDADLQDPRRTSTSRRPTTAIR